MGRRMYVVYYIICDFVSDVCRYTDYTVHAQGGKWDDGCTYRCECIDASKNNYKCTSRLVLVYIHYHTSENLQEFCCVEARKVHNSVLSKAPDNF